MFCSVTASWALTTWTSHPETTTDSTLASKIGQSFTVYANGESLTSLTVYVGTNPLDDATLNIYSGVSGTAGSLIGTAATGISGSGTVTITCSTPITVDSGSQYTWMLEQDTDFNLIVSTSGNGVFSGGDLVYDDTSEAYMDARFILTTASLGQISYDGNGNSGGTVPIDTTVYSDGASVTILGNSGNLVKSGYTFIGWNSAADGSGESYEERNSFTFDGTGMTLYAQWKKFPWPIFLPSLQGPTK